MPDPLQPLLDALASAQKRQGGSALTLDAGSLADPSWSALCKALSDRLAVTSLQLGGVQLPSTVTEPADGPATFTVSGDLQGVTFELTFDELAGEVAIEALLHAPQRASFSHAFPAAPSGFFTDLFAAIQVENGDATAIVSVPGLESLTFSSPSYGVLGRALPSSGLVTTTIGPRVDGQVSTPAGKRSLVVELQTATGGYRLAPATDDWCFDDVSWLIGGVNVLTAVGKTMIETHDDGNAALVVLREFELRLSPQAPGLSSLVLEIAHRDDDTPARSTPLWSALGGKVKLSDVVVTLDLGYGGTDAHTLSPSDTGAVDGRFSIGPTESQIPLDVQIPFPHSGIWSLTALPNLPLPTLTDILWLLEGTPSQHANLLPANLGGVGSFTFEYLCLAVDVTSFSLVEFTIGLGTSAPWRLIEGAERTDPPRLQLESLQISVTIDGTPSITGSVVGTIELAAPNDSDGNGSEIVVCFGRGTPAPTPWRLDVMSPAIVLPSIDQLTELAGVELGSMVGAGGLAQREFVMTDLNIGVEISPQETSLTNLGLTLQLADTKDSGDPLTPTLDWELIPDRLVLKDFSVGFQLDLGQDGEKEALGTFVVLVPQQDPAVPAQSLEFDVRFSEQGSADAFIAEYSAGAGAGAGTVDVAALISELAGKDPSPDAPKLEIGLKDMLLAYMHGAKPKYVFAVDIAAELVASNLPLIGSELPADASVGLKDLKVIFASDSLTAADVNTINDVSHAAVLPPPANTTGDAIPSGFSMIAQLGIGPLTATITSPPPAQPAQPVTSAAAHGAVSANSGGAGVAAVPVPAPAAPGLWKDVGKSVGPLDLRRIGVTWAEGRAWLLFDAGLAFGPLAISLNGLSLSTPLTEFQPAFGLQGAGVSLQTEAVTIDGAFSSLTPGGLSDPNWEYGGEVVIATPAFTISGVAAYGENGGSPSFFAFVMLSAELGGPPFFYVTGLAGGFGYNRALRIPTLDELPGFPLIAAATAADSSANPFTGKTDPSAALGVLDTYLPEATGESWFAVGVHFESFGLVDSFALLTLAFGTDLEVALLGLSKITVPTEASDPIAYAELVLEVTFSEREGKLAVAAQLTPASYVLAKACHLTGGFAFYSWLKDNADGATAGDFVVTLGGYNPTFDKPDQYPAVPPVGANWQVTDNLSVKGDLYFALTPSSVMAGGALEATWHSGDLKAWFDAHADFILSWRPLHYAATLGVSLGASYVLDLWFCSCTFTVSLGVTVSLSGPPFGGQANVDLYVVSFTISFGATQPAKVDPMPWSDYAKTLGPIASVQIVAGLVSDLTKDKQHDEDPDWVVAPASFHLVTQSAVPCTESSLVSGNDATKPLNDQLPNSFGVGPVGVADGDLSSTHKITIHKLTDQGAPDTSVDLRDRISCVPVSRNLPRAPWSKALSLDLVNNPSIATINNVSPTIEGLVTGYDISPAPQPLTSTPPPVEVGDLGGSPAPDESFSWSSASPPTTDPFDQSKAFEELISTIDDAGVAAARAAILAALNAEGVSVASSLNVGPIRNDADQVLRAPPLLSLLGEESVVA